MSLAETLNRRVARELRAEMARQEKSQDQLAWSLCTSQSKVSRWLRGATPMTLDDVERVVGVLDVPLEQVLLGALAGAA